MTTRRLSIAEALREAIAEEMERDARVFCIGEDIAVPGGWGGAFTVTLGLEKRFPGRMIDTPIAELGFFGVACGAAMMGMRRCQRSSSARCSCTTGAPFLTYPSRYIRAEAGHWPSSIGVAQTHLPSDGR